MNEELHHETAENLTFGLAVKCLKRGGRVTRPGWNGKGMWLELQPPGTDPSPRVAITRPYIYMYTAQGDYIPWLASQADVLAEDWMILRDAS